MIHSDLTYYAHQSFDDCDKEIDDSQNMNYLQALNCLTNNVFYIFDYTRNKLIYPDDLIEFLGHKFPLTNQGYQFYEKYVHPDDLKMLIKINKLAFDFFYTLKPEQKKYVNIVYDIRLKEINGTYVLVNHHLTPLTLATDGRIAQALCLISSACYQHPGNIFIKLNHSKMVLEYNSELDRFVENKLQNITQQESFILKQLAQGFTETQVAEQSKLSINTIKFHKKNLFKKLGIDNITSALQWFNIYKKL